MALSVNNTDPDGQADSPLRVLVVDDSAFMRFTISKRLNETPGIRVVGSARDGAEALELIPKLNPEVVTLDAEMPRLDGLSTLKEIMARYPRPVIMLSSLTSEGARETVQALTWGAFDFIAKPATKVNIDVVMNEVIAKIQRAARARVFPISPLRKSGEASLQSPPNHKTRKPTSHRRLQAGDKIVVIGASTGGPRALSIVIPLLPEGLKAAVLVVQHMPVGFTRSLAERLDSLAAIPIKEAAPGDQLEIGHAYLAPGGFHMTLDPGGQIALNQNPPVHGVRPAVDVTMTSVVQRHNNATIGVVLTGMGNDGTNGAALIHNAGGHVIAEDESTCVVWGMPRCVAESGAADVVVPLQDVAAAIERAVNTTSEIIGS